MAAMAGPLGARILIVDHDEVVTSVVKHALERDAYETAVAHDLAGARDLIGRLRPDGVVLDLVDKGAERLAFCRELRRDHPGIGILMVATKDAAVDQITGLDAGADDYLMKPFSLQVLEAHLRAVLRRRQPEPEILRAADLELNTATRRARRNGREIDLTATEFRVLAQLMRASGTAIPKHELTQRVWGHDFTGNDNVLEVYIGYLRNKLEQRGEPRLIHTLRGIGYALRAPAMA